MCFVGLCGCLVYRDRDNILYASCASTKISDPKGCDLEPIGGEAEGVELYKQKPSAKQVHRLAFCGRLGPLRLFYWAIPHTSLKNVFKSG